MRDSERSCIEAKELGMRALNYCDGVEIHGYANAGHCDAMMREIVLKMDQLISHITAQRALIEELKGNV
jgi:hypothetical protein